MIAKALREAVAQELFDDTANDRHGQLCPIWTRRPERRRKNEKGPAWTDCDCWQLNRVRHLATIALGAPALRAVLAAAPVVLDAKGFAADRPTGPRTMEGHALASRMRRLDAGVDWDAWIRGIEDEAVALSVPGQIA